MPQFDRGPDSGSKLWLDIGRAGHRAAVRCDAHQRHALQQLLERSVEATELPEGHAAEHPGAVLEPLAAIYGPDFRHFWSFKAQIWPFWSLFGSLLVTFEHPGAVFEPLSAVDCTFQASSGFIHREERPGLKLILELAFAHFELYLALL